MAIVTRYFSTAAAGAGDGTSWANRAQLVSGSTWSSVITAFDFSGGSDSLLCLIGPGTHTTGAALASGVFTVAIPLAAKQLFLHGCDSSGNRLEPSNPDWVSGQPVDWESSLPIIATTTNVSAINLAHCELRLLKFTASGATTNPILNTCSAGSWLVLDHSGSNSSAVGINTSFLSLENVCVRMAGTSYASAVSATNACVHDNIRCEGNGSTATSGNRRGLQIAGTTSGRRATRICVSNFVGEGLIDTGSSTGNALSLSQILSYNTAGIKLNTTASQTTVNQLSKVICVGSSGWGLDAGASNTPLSQSRFRDNASGDLTNFGNYPTTWVDVSDIYANQAAADTAEFVDTSIGDFRIKYGSPIWGYGYGCGDQPNPSVSGGLIGGGNLSGGLQ